MAGTTRKRSSNDTTLDAPESAISDAEKFLKEAENAIDVTFSPCIVLPGDDLTTTITKSGNHVKLGSGLKHIKEPHNRIVASNCGILRYRPPNRYWIDYDHKRYIASVDDSVIGIVIDRNAEFYRLNIGSTNTAVLGTLAFDGATKRNRPNLQVGSLVYARVIKADVECELTCEAPPNVNKRDWMTGLSIYGELSGGYNFRVSVGFARQLLRAQDDSILHLLGRSISYEIAIGQNGIVWLQSKANQHTVLLANALLNSECMTQAQVETMIQTLLKPIA